MLSIEEIKLITEKLEKIDKNLISLYFLFTSAACKNKL